MKIGIIVVLIALLTACGENKDKERTISVSILPQRYFVERIAGDYVKVNVMIPPGANPAVSDLSTEQLKALHNSSVYFAVGYLPFELSNLYPFLETQKNMLLVKQSVGMDLEQGACNHSLTKPPLRVCVSLIVICSGHSFSCLAYFKIVGGERIRV